jgi:glucose-6-phosphate-specific signal transduction histidine kinase
MAVVPVLGGRALRHRLPLPVATGPSTGDETSIRLSIRDDGVGGADSGRGSGLVGLKDRVEVLGGTITVESPPDGGTSLVVALPREQLHD